MKCAECGAETADAQFCVRCGAPAAQQRSVAAAKGTVGWAVLAPPIEGGTAGWAPPEPAMPGSGHRVPPRVRRALRRDMGVALALFAGGGAVAIADLRFGRNIDNSWGLLVLYLWAQAVFLLARWFRFSRLLRRPGPARGATLTAHRPAAGTLALKVPGAGRASLVKVHLPWGVGPETLLPGENVTFYGRADGVGALLVSAQQAGTFLGTARRKHVSRTAREMPPGPGDAGLAKWVESCQFSTTRLRPGYDKEEVDAFLEAIRDTFVGISEPLLTPDSVRDKKFSTTRLRPGYVEEEIDVFLDEVEARLPVRCVECGAPVAEPARACAECGAPPVGQLSAAADPVPGEPDGSAAIAAARDARSIPGRARLRYYSMCFVCYLALVIAFMVASNAPVNIEELRQAAAVSWIIGLVGAILSLAPMALFVPHRRLPRLRQVAWVLVPILSVSWLAFAPFLWVADIRRRAQDWAVLAAYLAAVAVEMYFIAVGYPGSVAWNISYAMMLLVGGIAAVHAGVAFRPAARVPTWYDVHATKGDDECRQPVTGAVTRKTASKAPN